jgi:hypothetical protein
MGYEEQYEADLENVASRLRTKVRELEVEILPIQEQLSRLRVQLDFVERALNSGNIAPHPELQVADVTSSKPSVSDRIFEILNEAARPLHITEIKDHYVAKGFTVPGQGTDSNLLVYIVRDSRFARVSKGTYALTEAGAPPKSPAKPKAKRRRRRKA